MRVMDGYETTAEIRRREAGRKHVPIDAVTANTAQGNVEKCLASRMGDFLGKPIRPAVPDTTLGRWVARPARMAPPLLLQNPPYY
jgi:CheY-like chemotaxis protein